MRKVCADFPNYEVDDLGNVFSMKTGKKLVTVINHNGGKQLMLINNGKRINVLVHRLIAKTFLDNPESKTQVNHIDGNRENNRINNLEWCTPKENIWHARNILKRKMGNFKLSDADILSIKNLLKIGKSQRMIAKKFNVTQACISLVNRRS